MSTVERAEYKKHPVYGYTALKNESWISERAKEARRRGEENIRAA